MAFSDWKNRRDANAARLMLILKACAEKNQMCPDSGVLAREMKLTANMVGTLFDDLRDAGRIDWQVIFCAGLGRRRWVRLLKEGVATAKPQGSMRSSVKKPSQATLLDKAKVVLQRRGAWVWDASVEGGPRGMVKVDSQYLTPEAVIERAGLSIEGRA